MNRNSIPCPKESVEQTQLFQWAGLQKCVYPELEYLIAIPNGGSRDKIEAAHLKAQGVKAGVSDILLPVARGGYHGLWIELKRRHGGKLSSEQETWLDAMQDEGYMAVCCLGFEEARTVIVEYLAQSRGTRPCA